MVLVFDELEMENGMNMSSSFYDLGENNKLRDSWRKRRMVTERWFKKENWEQSRRGPTSRGGTDGFILDGDKLSAPMCDLLCNTK